MARKKPAHRPAAPINPEHKAAVRGKARLNTSGRQRKFPNSSSGLDDAQLGKLSLRLFGTTGNVYELCRAMFQREVTDGVFNDLGRKLGLCRCEFCSVWKHKDKGNYSDDPKDGVSFVCKKCLDDVNEDGGEDD